MSTMSKTPKTRPLPAVHTRTEVVRKSGGFAIYSQGEKAVGSVKVELLQWLANTSPMDEDGRWRFLERFAETLDKFNVYGAQQKFELGPIIFRTGR